jgi:hypothetical protein
MTVPTDPCAYCKHPPHLANECPGDDWPTTDCRCPISMPIRQQDPQPIDQADVIRGALQTANEMIELVDDGEQRRRTSVILTEDDRRTLGQPSTVPLEVTLVEALREYPGLEDAMASSWRTTPDQQGHLREYPGDDELLARLAEHIAEYLARQPAPILGVIRPPESSVWRLGLPSEEEWTDPDAPFDWSARRAQEAAAADDLSEN